MLSEPLRSSHRLFGILFVVSWSLSVGLGQDLRTSAWPPAARPSSEAGRARRELGSGGSGAGVCPGRGRLRGGQIMQDQTVLGRLPRSAPHTKKRMQLPALFH